MRALLLAAVGAAALLELAGRSGSLARLAVLRFRLRSTVRIPIRPWYGPRVGVGVHVGGPVHPRPAGRTAHRRRAQGALKLYVYPAAGQSEAQTADDRYQCHIWAAGQSGSRPDARRRQPRRGRRLHARVHGLHGRAQLCRQVGRCSPPSLLRRRCRRRPPKTCARSRFRASAASRSSKRGAIVTSATTGPSRRRARRRPPRRPPRRPTTARAS